MGFSKEAAARACRSMNPPLPVAELASLLRFVGDVDESRLSGSFVNETDAAGVIVAYLQQESAAAASGAGLSGAGGSVVQTDFALDTLLVSQPLPPCVYSMGLDKTGTVSVHSGVPRMLKQWKNFSKDANSWAVDKADTLLAGKTATLARADAALLVDGAFRVMDEAGVYSYWDNVLGPALSALWSTGLLGAQPTLSKGALLKGQSDRGICFPASAVIVPVQIKHRFALPAGTSPFATYKATPGGKEKTALQQHVEQIYGYLHDNGLYYGILCTDEEYYFLKREADTTLLHSDAVKRSQLQPSVIAAISYVTHLALQQRGPAGTNAGSGGTGVGGGWKLPKIFSRLVAILGVQLQLVHTWLRLKGPSAPLNIKSSSLNLGRRLGSGITGVVYHGISPLGRQLAIKVPSREGRKKQGTELQLQQLDNEVSVYQALRKLQGSVVPILMMHGTMVTDAGDDIPFLATEFLEGAVPLSEPSVEQWPSTLAVDASASLAAVHAQGVAQCDVRPEHLFLMPDGSVKIVDFGHARMGSAVGPEDMARDVQDLGNLLAELQPREQERLGQPACEVLVSTTGDSVQAGMSRMALGTDQGRPTHRGGGVSAGARALHPSARRAMTSNTHGNRLLRAYSSVNRAGRVMPSLRMG